MFSAPPALGCAGFEVDEDVTPPPGGARVRVVGQRRRFARDDGHHYAEAVSLDALSQHTQLSRYHLVRVFRNAV